MFKDLSKRLFKSKPIAALVPSKPQYIGKIRLFHGDVLDHLDCDAVVTFITEDLSMGGPLNKIFLEQAGEELGDYIAEQIHQPKQGEAFIVPAFKLPVKKVVLTVLPAWKGGIADEDRAMQRCYRHAVKLAQESGIKSIAFPALGFHRLNFPHIRFARLALRGILDALDDRMGEVRIVCKERGIADIYAEHLRKLGRNT